MNKTLSQNFEKMFRSKVKLNQLYTVTFSVPHLKKTTLIMNGSSYKETVIQFFRQYIKL